MKKKRYAKVALFLTAMLWGSTFAIGKIATEVFSASFVIALRFTVASIALIIVAAPLYKLLNKEYWINGIWMGITLFISYILQVEGLAADTEKKGIQPAQGGDGSQYQQGSVVVLRNGQTQSRFEYADQNVGIFQRIHSLSYNGQGIFFGKRIERTHGVLFFTSLQTSQDKV